jgi:uncharacterized membrane protein
MLYKTGHSVAMRGKTLLSLFALSIRDIQKRRQIIHSLVQFPLNLATILLVPYGIVIDRNSNRLNGWAIISQPEKIASQRTLTILQLI